MRWGVVVFPGSNDDEDALWALSGVLGQEALALWHKDEDLKGVEAVVLPGGFSFGDYLRCGALARFSPVMQSVSRFAADGGLVMGFCNGFQILCEAGLLPGALLRNRSLSFVCETVRVRVENASTPFTNRCRAGQVLEIPVKHGDGQYFADAETLLRLNANGQILFRYVDEHGRPTPEANPNGSLENVAGVMNEGRNVFGMMPHPEHAVERPLGSDDGLALFRSILAHRGEAAEAPREPRGGLCAERHA